MTNSTRTQTRFLYTLGEAAGDFVRYTASDPQTGISVEFYTSTSGEGKFSRREDRTMAQHLGTVQFSIPVTPGGQRRILRSMLHDAITEQEIYSDFLSTVTGEAEVW
ncbi:MAG: hypothetical protein FWF25_06205 [Propionibacteriaceae bacterium]|nr:hypothetical protein [Propionibacteriaceae bacterium]